MENTVLMSAVLDVQDLRVGYQTEDGRHWAVDGISLTIGEGETFSLVGESGSGKTSVALSIPRLLPESASVSGTVEAVGSSIYQISEGELQELRRKNISFIFQDPVGSLIPNVPVGKQLKRTIGYRAEITEREQRDSRARELLDQVGLPDAERLWTAYPSQLSGGMCQRVMIALALSVEPALVIADEPTSALDAIMQERILELLMDLQQRYQFGMLFVTHDLRIASQLSTHVGVMKEGEMVEAKPAQEFFQRPDQAYTESLIASAEKLSL
jgi:ABC-type dipeptide/oligopeptide/nickel transport system ATPase component